MIVIMRLLFYNILILIFLPVAVGRILYKSIKDKDYRLNLSQRFGIYKVNSSKKQVIWFHAVSLGEVIASEKIVNKLLKDADVILTVTTPTGLRHARKIYGDDLKIYYAPWDNLVFMNRAINSFMPSVIVIFETEIWPSMIHCSFKKDIPIILCNGRMSQRSFKSYSRFKALVNTTLQKFSFIFVQSENQAKRFFELGANIEQLKIVSSVKFDSHEPNEELGNRVNEPEKDKILLFASTHRGEDERLIKIYINLKTVITNLRLVIVPRHPERHTEIERILTKEGVNYSLQNNSMLEFEDNEVIVINAIGILAELYAKADAAFIGGSMLGDTGGHNIIEPAASGCPFVVGEHMYNFTDILESFLLRNACIQASSDKEIELSLKSILTDNDHHGKINALEVVKENKGSSDLQARKILSFLN